MAMEGLMAVGIHVWLLLNNVGWVRLCRSKAPRRRERLGGFWWDYEGSDGLLRGSPLSNFLRVDWL